MDQTAVPPPIVQNAIEFNEARFDQPRSPLNSKILICTSQRTGSFLLGRTMLHHGLGVPHEYWNPRHTGELSARWGASDRDYIDAVLAHRTVDGVFSAKVQWWQYDRFLDNPAGHALLQGAHFIYLYREDLLDQAISLRISHLTGRWGLDGRVTTGTVGGAAFHDTAAIEKLVDEMADADRSWRRFFALRGTKPITVSYEQMFADPASFVQKVITAFDLTTRYVPNYREARVEIPRDTNIPSSAELRTWFQAQRR